MTYVVCIVRKSEDLSNRNSQYQVIISIRRCQEQREIYSCSNCCDGSGFNGAVHELSNESAGALPMRFVSHRAQLSEVRSMACKKEKTVR